MSARVVRCEGSHRLSGEDGSDDLVNRFLDHLVTRGFSSATVRAYAFDLANLLAFLAEGALTIGQVRAVDLFAYLDWQRKQRVGVAASTMNRRVSTVRSWCEFLVTIEELVENPVPRPRRSSGLRTCAEACSAMLLGLPARGRRVADL